MQMSDPYETMEFMARASQRRKTEATSVNDGSSRSHAFYRFTFPQCAPDDSTAPGLF